MSVLGTVKTDVVMPAESTSSGSALAEGPVDTQGYNRAVFAMLRGGQAIAWSFAWLEESETSGGTYTKVPNAFLGTDCVDVEGTAVTCPLNAGRDGSVVFDIDLAGRKRFLKFSGINGSGTSQNAALCFLFSPSNIYTDTQGDYVITQNDPAKGARYARL